jgi:hypothetical protein
MPAGRGRGLWQAKDSITNPDGNMVRSGVPLVTADALCSRPGAELLNVVAPPLESEKSAAAVDPQ